MISMVADDAWVRDATTCVLSDGEVDPASLSDDRVVSTVAQACPIGRVLQISGNASVIRKGVKLELKLGDLIHKDDVIETGPDSVIDIGFVDGSVFRLSADTGMIVREFIYNSTSVALFDLDHGSFSFIAGNLIKTGDLKINVPTASLAIHGVAVPAEVTANSSFAKFSLL